jgi:hypothetical protein
MDKEETIEIPLHIYHEMIDDCNLLTALRAAGVDNWDGWDYAIEIYNEMDDE